jgi:hypothetical protein
MKLLLALGTLGVIAVPLAAAILVERRHTRREMGRTNGSTVISPPRLISGSGLGAGGDRQVAVVDLGSLEPESPAQVDQITLPPAGSVKIVPAQRPTVHASERS